MADLQDEYAARIRAIYERAELRILEEVRKRAARGIVEPGWAERKAAEIASLREWLQGQLPGLLMDVPSEVRGGVQAGYEAGGKEAGQDLIAANLSNPAPQAYARGASVRALASEAVGNLTATHSRILRSALDAYREVIAGAAEDVLTGVATRRTATQAALNRFADRGVSGFVDKAGRSWDLGSYSEMATRSAVIRSSLAGKAAKYEAAGQDLVIVSDHWEECELCAEWEGKVLSLRGETKGYPTLDDAEAEGLFHPNCRHSYAPYVKSLTRIPERQSPKDKEEQKRVYKERTTQRRLERGIRQWKRREMAAIDPVEQAKASRKVIAWQKGLDAHVEAVNARRSDLGIPAMKKQPGRERVIFAPDAKRTAREAAGVRRSVAAADRKAAELAEAAAAPVVSKIDLDAKKPQRIGTSADLRKVYPKGTPGAEFAGSKPTVFTAESIGHVRRDHPERGDWLRNNTDEVRGVLESPEAVSETPEWNERHKEWRVKFVGPCPMPDQKPGMAVFVVGFQADSPAVVVTGHPMHARRIFKASGEARSSYRKVEKAP